MKHTPKKYVKSGSEKFVKTAKKALILVSVVLIIAAMVLLVCCFESEGATRTAFIVATAAVVVVLLVMYGYYAMNISMGTVLGIEVTDKVVHLVTKRKTFTYDVKRGCVAVKVKRSKFIGTFETQDSRDKFCFYRHAPFSKYSDGQFTKEDIRLFFDRIDEAVQE